MNKRNMKYISTVLFLVTFGTLSNYAQLDFNEYMEQQKKESLEFNATVTDVEIIEYLEFKYLIDQDMLVQFRQSMSKPEERIEFLTNYRKMHNEAGMQLPTLKDMTEKERAQLVMMFEMKKDEYYESVAAEKIQESLSKDQLKLVLNAGIELIGNYEFLNKDSNEATIKITSNFPVELSFLNLYAINLYDNGCMLLLQKGIGKGIGFDISKDNGDWKLSSFNEYKSWDRQEIDLQ